ncbi:hypothetical protein OJAV_G00135760 [Oryzias javanicus]|uniref:Pyrin domain-containing protein n=1 Tax=Oryzias javanicus TaxID=123683 RepID=A0A437CKV9_ORYJA|nr:hypothetical protein OJAV_G00135760 [Oryzias javanicus]
MAAERWKLTLIKILEQLDDQQYEKTLLLLKKIPKRKKEEKSRAQMAQTIIEHYGDEKSVLEVDRIMKVIPRMDNAVQNLLRPFVEKIKAGKKRKLEADPETGLKMLRQKSAAGKKRKLEADPKTGGKMLQKKSAAGSKKNQVVSDSSGKNKEPGKKRKLDADPKVPRTPNIMEQKSAAGKKRKQEDDPKTGGKIVQKKSAAGSKKNQEVLDSSGKNKEPGKKRKLEADPKTGLKILQKKSAAGSKENQVLSDSSGKNKEPGDLKSPQLDEVQPSSSWRKPIAELQNGVDLSQKSVVGKVVEKSDLRTYETKEKQKKFFFYLGIADDSGCIKVMVYGKDKYSVFKEGECYNFRNVIVEENIMKFTSKSSTSRAGKLDVPKDLEQKARMLIYGEDPVVSIEEIKRLDEKERVSVEGTVIEIRKTDSVVTKENQTKIKIRKFKLEDRTRSIYITLWGKGIQHLKGVSVGDTVKVTNLKTNHCNETVSLNSTDSTRIIKLKCATLQDVQMEIVGIKKAGKLQMELDIVIDKQAKFFSVKSAVLAEALGVQQGSDVEKRLLEKIPCLAKAKIKGDRILKLTGMKDEERVQMRM